VTCCFGEDINCRGEHRGWDKEFIATDNCANLSEGLPLFAAPNTPSTPKSAMTCAPEATSNTAALAVHEHYGFSFDPSSFENRSWTV